MTSMCQNSPMNAVYYSRRISQFHCVGNEMEDFYYFHNSFWLLKTKNLSLVSNCHFDSCINCWSVNQIRHASCYYTNTCLHGQKCNHTSTNYIFKITSFYMQNIQYLVLAEQLGHSTGSQTHYHKCKEQHMLSSSYHILLQL